jgi:hypothetical protein
MTAADPPVADKYADWPQEAWTYGGVRVDSKGTRKHQWIEPDGSPGLYADKGSFVIGGLYHVRVQRDGKHTTRTTPRYTGETVEREERAALEIKDRASRRELAAKSRERNDAAQSALDEALEPLLAIARKTRNGSDLEALVAYVSHRIYAPHWKVTR